MKVDAAKNIFDSLNTYADLQKLIENGDSEGLHLECKAPTVPRLSREQKVNLAKAVSGFWNTEGGVIMWGMSTTKKEKSGLDVITQIESLGNCRYFAKLVETIIPTLTSHPVTNCENKVITRRKGDTRGVVITYVPKGSSNPILSNKNNVFYFRSGDGFEPLPYELIKNLFAAAGSPKVSPVFNPELVEVEDDFWKILLLAKNESYAAARDVTVSLTILNPSNCEKISGYDGFRDESALNLGKRVFSARTGLIYKGLNVKLGGIKVKMKKEARKKRSLRIKIEVFADKMIATSFLFSIQLTGRRFKLIKSEEVSS